MNAETVADWCVSDGKFAMSGTRMKEHSREPHGELRWCFRCRAHRQFWLVVKVPDGLSYYGPEASVRCTICDTSDGDLFPGRYREWE